MNTEKECEWLRSTHLTHITFPVFESFKLIGSEDSPHSVELYARRRPEYNDQPVATYTQDEESGVLAGPPRPTIIRRRTRPGA